MKRDLIRLAGVVALLAAACASPASQAVTLQASTAPTPTMEPLRTPTPTPTSTPTSEPTPTPVPPQMLADAPTYCVAPEKGEPQDIVSTPASPYFVRQPTENNPNVPTIVFLGGGWGSRRSAQRVWANYLSGGRGVDAFRVVLPYSVDVAFTDYEAHRTFKVVDEVLACYGGDPAQVHLAGFSNGGITAFDLMLERPDRFATLLGAPGLFTLYTTPNQWAEALCGKAVFNGVGSADDGWKQDVRTNYEGLQSVGIESVYVEFAGQGHSLSEAFDETVFIDFWRAHGPGKAPNLTDAKGHCRA